jgi:hypothetical protein
VVIDVEGHYGDSLVHGFAHDLNERDRIDDIQGDPIVTLSRGLANHVHLGADVHFFGSHESAFNPHASGRVSHALLDRLEEILADTRGDERKP